MHVPSQRSSLLVMAALVVPMSATVPQKDTWQRRDEWCIILEPFLAVKLKNRYARLNLWGIYEREIGVTMQMSIIAEAFNAIRVARIIKWIFAVAATKWWKRKEKTVRHRRLIFHFPAGCPYIFTYLLKGNGEGRNLHFTLQSSNETHHKILH